MLSQAVLVVVAAFVAAGLTGLVSVALLLVEFRDRRRLERLEAVRRVLETIDSIDNLQRYGSTPQSIDSLRRRLRFYVGIVTAHHLTPGMRLALSTIEGCVETVGLVNPDSTPALVAAGQVLEGLIVDDEHR